MTPGCMAEIIKPAKKGIAEIRIDVPDPFDRLRGAMRGKPLEAEKYTRLLINNDIYMTDAEFECLTNWHVRYFHGNILIGGLGIGLVLNSLVKKDDVDQITVIELHQDVIDLVSPYFNQDKVKIIKDDVFKWTPPKKTYNFVYMDIWKNVPNSDQDDELKELRKRYRPSLKKGGKFRVWCEEKIDD